MIDSDLTKLRRARIRVHAQLNKLEPLVAGYRAKLAEIEARIQDLAPELFMQPRRYRPNPVFARNELPRLAIAILREAGEPLPIRTIMVRALAAKGVTLPDRHLRKLTRTRLGQLFSALDKRGLTVKVGGGNGAVRGLA